MSDIKSNRGGSAKILNELNMSVVLDRIRYGNNVSRSSLSREHPGLPFRDYCRIVSIKHLDSCCVRAVAIEGVPGFC